MFNSIQSCQCMAGSWFPALAAAPASASAAAAVRTKLPILWASFHINSSSHSAALPINRHISSLQEGGTDAVSTSSTHVQQLQHIIDSNMQSVPRAARTGDKALLTDSQRDSLALFRRFNISQPQLRGHVILAKVLRSTPKHLLVDPGYYGMNVVPRQDLASAGRYNERGEPLPMSSTIQPGEYVKLRLSAFETPYGDAQLDPVGIPKAVRQKLVWEELEHRMRKGEPVKGRILNNTTNGYAVGIAGYVALLNRQQAPIDVTKRIGVLQQFYIHSMDPRKSLISLSNMARRNDDMQDVWKQTL